MSLSIITLNRKEFTNKLEKPPVIIILKDFLVSFLINSIILLIKPTYPQKNPDLTAFIVFLPITLFIFFKLSLGIKVALFINVLRDKLTPGAIIPPL